MNRKGERKKSFLVFLMAVSMLTQQTSGVALAEEDLAVQETMEDSEGKSTDLEGKNTDLKLDENGQNGTEPEVSEAAQDESDTEGDIKPDSEAGEDADTQKEAGTEGGIKPDSEAGEDADTQEGVGAEAAKPDSGAQDNTDPEAPAEIHDDDEKEPDAGTEEDADIEEKSVLTASVVQEVYLAGQDENLDVMVRCSITVSNISETAASESTVIKAVLPETLDYCESPDETEGIQVQANTVYWEEQTIAAASQNTYVFSARADQGIQDTARLTAVYYVDEQHRYGKLSWDGFL